MPLPHSPRFIPVVRFDRGCAARCPMMSIRCFVAVILLAGALCGRAFACPDSVRSESSSDKERVTFERSCDISPESKSTGFFAWLAEVLFGSVTQERATLGKPAAVAFDSAGNVYVTDLASAHLYLLPRDNTPWKCLDDENRVTFKMPVSMAIYADTLYIVDAEAGTISVLSTSGALLRQIKPAMKRPTAVCVDARALYVVDAIGCEVQVLSRTGDLVRKFGLKGSNQTEFNTPTNIAIDHDTLCIVDAMNFRVALFTVTGTYVGSVGEQGDAPGTFSRPKGIALDNAGNMFVVDALQSCVQVFSKQGVFLMTIGAEGADAPGRFQLPSGIAIAPDGRIAVADSYNHRVQVFQHHQ